MATTQHDHHIVSAAKQLHVVLLAFPFGFHAGLLYTLARKLAVTTPDTTFSFLNTAKSNASLARMASSSAPSINNLRVYSVSAGCPEDFIPSTGNPEEEIELFMKETPGNFRKGMEEAVREAGGVGISCLVSDCFLWFAREMADEMGVTWVALWPSSPGSLLVHAYTDIIRSTIGVGDQALSDRAEEKLDFMPGMSAVRVQDLPEGVIFGHLDSVFSRLLHGMAQELPHAAAVVLNTYEGLEPAIIADLKTKFKKCLLMGPMNLLAPKPTDPDKSGCLPWLDRHAAATVVYVAFGTVASPPPAELAELAQGLEASCVPFLWSLKEQMWPLLPAGFLDRTNGRGLVVPWTPQVQVLVHPAVGIFVSHGGWYSVMEAIAAGMPIICRPFFGDHRINSRMISQVWEIGIGIEGGVFTKDRVVSTLNLVLKTEEGKRLRERVLEFAERAVRAVGPGGSSAVNFNSLVAMLSTS